MGIFDIFTQQQPQQQQQQEAPPAAANLETPPAQGTKTSEGTAPNGVVPDSVPKTKEPASPLENFKDLWQTTDNKEGEQQQPPSLDPEALKKAVSRIDFSSAVSPEVIEQVTAGGENAAQAFAQALSSVAQQAVMQSTLVSHKLAEQAAQRAREEALKEIPSIVKKQGVADSLTSANPLFSDPAVKPVLESVQQQLTVKYPEATASELTKMAQDYVLAMSKAFAPPQETNTQQQQTETDWEKFLG